MGQATAAAVTLPLTHPARELGGLGAGAPPEVEALQALAEGTFDVVVSDLVMSRGSGADLADRLAASRPGLPAVLIAGHAGETVLRHLRGREGARLLRKPVSLERLARALSELLPGGG